MPQGVPNYFDGQEVSKLCADTEERLLQMQTMRQRTEHAG